VDIYYGVGLFVVGVLGCFVVRKNLVIVLMALELMFIGVSLNFVVYSIYLDDMVGQLIALFILVVAAAESAIGLAMIVIYHKLRGIINVSFINMLKG
jgi:NADH:ubiquinone oxidoreductase subunit K